MSNMAAAREVEKGYGVEIVVIKKTSQEYGQIKDPLPCPSVVVNGRIIARNDIVSYEALKDAILSGSGRKEG
jgi:hypothetical protein